MGTPATITAWPASTPGDASSNRTITVWPFLRGQLGQIYDARAVNRLITSSNLRSQREQTPALLKNVPWHRNATTRARLFGRNLRRQCGPMPEMLTLPIRSKVRWQKSSQHFMMRGLEIGPYAKAG